MESENLNECVDALLVRKSKAAFEQHAAALENARKQAVAKRGFSAFKSVDDLAKKNTVPTVVIRHRAKGSKNAQKRLRKNRLQNKVLMAEFKKEPNWTRCKIQKLHERLGLNMSQIYKWNWDM